MKQLQLPCAFVSPPFAFVELPLPPPASSSLQLQQQQEQQLQLPCASSSLHDASSFPLLSLLLLDSSSQLQRLRPFSFSSLPSCDVSLQLLLQQQLQLLPPPSFFAFPLSSYACAPLHHHSRISFPLLHQMKNPDSSFQLSSQNSKNLRQISISL